MARAVMFLSSSFLLLLCLSVSAVIVAEAEEMSGDGMYPPSDCLNCPLCGSYCYPQPSPPPTYIQYTSPPPPHPAEAECPPSTAEPCCQYPPPTYSTPRTPNSEMPYYNYAASYPLLLHGRVFSSLCCATLFLLFCGVLF